MAQLVNNLPANAGDTREMCSIRWLGRYLGGENATHSITLAAEIRWTEELGGLQSMGSQRVGHN